MLWNRFISKNRQYAIELNGMTRHFSSDSTVISRLSDIGLLDYVRASSVGESVRVLYKSPWRHKEPKEFREDT